MDEPGLFDLLRNASKIKDLMGRAGDLRGRIEQLKQDMANRTVEGEAGAGAVRVVMNGQMQVVCVKLEGPLLTSLGADGKEADQRMVEDLIAAAVNVAVEKSREMFAQEIAKATGGLNIPGLENMLQG